MILPTLALTAALNGADLPQRPSKVAVLKMSGRSNLPAKGGPNLFLEISQSPEGLLLKLVARNPTYKETAVPPMSPASVGFRCIALKNGVKIRDFQPYLGNNYLQGNMKPEGLVRLLALNELSATFEIPTPKALDGERLFIRAYLSAYVDFGKKTRYVSFTSPLTPIPTP